MIYQKHPSTHSGNFALFILILEQQWLLTQWEQLDSEQADQNP